MKLVKSANVELLSWWCDSEDRCAIEGSELYWQDAEWDFDEAGVIGP